MQKFFWLLCSMTLFISSCTGLKKTPTPQHPPAIPRLKSDQIDYTTVAFDRGEIELSEMDRKHLNDLAQKMGQSGKEVDDIKILTWADRATKNDLEATNTEIIIARQRAEAIKSYLQETLKADEDIDFYNMAESPERFNRYMERKGVSIPEALKIEGGSGSADGKALVIIEYQTAPVSSVL